MELQKYNLVAIVLHWVMALAFFSMITSGFLISEIIKDEALAHEIFEWHKISGITLLVAFFIRFTLRLVKIRPELPATLPQLQIKLAKIGHLVLYFFMFAMPVSGLLMVYGIPDVILGLFSLTSQSEEINKKVGFIANQLHFIFALAFITTITLHIAAVIKHYYFDKVNLLKRMWL